MHGTTCQWGLLAFFGEYANWTNPLVGHKVSDMANEAYKGHILISTATYQSDCKKYIAHVSIAWRTEDGFHFHRLEGASTSGRSAEEAVAQGFAVARLWVDKKL